MGLGVLCSPRGHITCRIIG